MMNIAQEILQTLSERLATTASVKQVFGEPITASGRTIIPVARVRYGLGAGFGSDKLGGGSDLGAGGGGGGGGVQASPVGVLEITNEGTRFERFFDPRQAIVLVGIGFALGMIARTLLSRD